MANLSGQMVITFNADGSFSINSQKVKGSIAEIQAELNTLTKRLGGELTIEKHLPGQHSHTHADGTEHVHH